MTTEGYPADVPNIALIGKAGAGKDTVATLLIERFRLGYQRVALADPLKDIASILWGPDARTDRTKLQELGLAVREIHESTWVDLLLRHIQRLERESLRPIRVVVTDVRFPNEYRTLKEAGFLMVGVHADRQTRIDRLRRNGKLQDEAQLDHVSETALDTEETNPPYWIRNIGDHELIVTELQKILRAVAA